MLKIESEVKKKEVRFLTNAAADFVSLVRHGAIQTPFKVIKSEKEGGEKMSLMVIQSLLLPQGQSLEKLTEKEELAWLSEAQVDNVQKFEEYNKLVQVDLKKFDVDSLRMVKLHDSGSWAIAGQLNEGEKAEKALTLGEAEVQKISAIVANPVFGAEVSVEQSVPGVVRQFGDMFDNELRNFLDVVHGALSQSAAQPTARKKTVMNAIDAFKMFVSMALDTIGKEAADVGSLDLKPKTEKPGGEVDMFKSMEEFTGAVEKVLDAREAAAKTAADEAAAAEAATLAAEKAEADAKLKKDTPAKKDEETDETPAWAKELTAKVDAVVTKQEEMEQQLSTSSGTQEDPPAKKDENEDLIDEDKDKSPFGGVFSGLLTRKRQAA